MKFANQDLIVDLIPILDNFERALKFDESKLDDNQKKFLQGFKMLYNSYNEVLKKIGMVHGRSSNDILKRRCK